jgi:proteasome lid subunit RPN8/RPN11
MSGKANSIVRIAPALRAAILDAASRAYPNECCGLLTGALDEGGWSVESVFETANISDTPRRNFLVDPEVQFTLMRALRGTGHRLIGCYHSHPDGGEAPSETDRAQAYESNFLYLIAAGEPRGGFRLNAFRYGEEIRNFEKLAFAV